MSSDKQSDFQTKSRQADSAAEEFAKLYYTTLDKKRQALHKLYMNTATIFWNGNIIAGIDAIKSFFENLPASEHKVDALDAQPVYNADPSGKLTIIVTVGGASKFEKKPASIFNNTFVMTSDNNVWKIVTETVRHHE